MANDKKTITIDCPDLGKSKIQEYITYGQIVDYRSLAKSDSHEAFYDLMDECVIEPENSLEKMSLEDIYYIAYYYMKDIDVGDIFEDIYERENNIPKAFYQAYKKSEIFKSFKKVSESFKITSNLLKPYEKNIYNKMLYETPKSIQSIQPMIDVQSKFISNLKSINFYESKYFNNKFLSEKVISEQLKYLNDYANNSLKIFNENSFINIIENTGISKHLKHLKEIQKNINNISNSIINKYDFVKDIQSFDSLSNTFLKETDEMISQSDLVVTNANRFFENRSVITNFIDEKEDKGKYQELDHEYEESEVIVQDEVSGLILAENDIIKIIKSVVQKSIDSSVDEKLSQYENLLDRMNFLSEPPSFLKLLKDYVSRISRQHWEVFWVDKGDKYVSNPESIAQSNLSMYLEGAYKGLGFVGREINSGNGYIDIFVNYLGKNYIVEIKMVGAGWGVGWAESGLSQLDDYMELFNDQEAYLVVFDGRKTSKGRQLDNKYELKNGTVNVVKTPIYF